MYTTELTKTEIKWLLYLIDSAPVGSALQEQMLESARWKLHIALEASK